MKIIKLLVVFSILFLQSCTKEDKGNYVVNAINQNFVSLNQANNIGSEIQINNYVGNKLSSENKSKFKNIESITEIEGQDGLSAFYIINYKDEGFVILSADNRINPILAYSAIKKFEIVDLESYPSGLQYWLSDKKDLVKNIRKLNGVQSDEIKNSWLTEQIVGLINPIDDEVPPGGGSGGGSGGGDEGCENTYYAVEPLLDTAWGQGYGFNNSTPYYNCSNTLNGNAWAGCAATAMAQIMKYYEFPTSYNWANMPNNVGSTETSDLILDIGLAVNMDYGCISSSADPSIIGSVFENDYGYSTNTVTSSYDNDTVKIQLESNWPVLLYGYNASGGHIWVNDGYRRTIYCETGAAYLLLHMNWGWKGNYDGWFNYNDWSVAGTNYNTNKRMIYNITP